MRVLKSHFIDSTFCCVRWIRHRGPAPRFQGKIVESKILTDSSPPSSSRPTLESLRKRLNLSGRSSPFSSLEVHASIPVSNRRETIEVRPPDRFYDLTKFEEGIAARQRIMHDKVFNDSEEVIRKKQKKDILKYMELACRGTHDATSLRKIAQLLENVSQKCEAEINMANSTASDDISIWIHVLNFLSEEELHQLWSCGFIDTEVIQAIINPLVSEERVEENRSSSKSSEGLVSFFFNGKSDLMMSSNLSERLKQFKKLYCLAKLTNEICDSIADLPSVELSPTFEKAMHKTFSDIRKADLGALESYEELRSVKLQSNENSKTHHFSISEAVLQRALFPSNYFLSAVSKHDMPLKKSLDVLERVKRHSLLDPAFQEALLVSKEMEKNIEISGSESSSKTRQRKKIGSSSVLKDPFAQRNGVTETPFFYSSRHNVVPPHGRFSLPSPRLPREVQRIQRRRKRKENTLFSR